MTDCFNEGSQHKTPTATTHPASQYCKHQLLQRHRPSRQPTDNDQGGDYDEKTDIYSLGIILFEICHPAFTTGMERAMVLRDLHNRKLPKNWVSLACPVSDVWDRRHHATTPALLTLPTTHNHPQPPTNHPLLNLTTSGYPEDQPGCMRAHP